MIFKKKLQQEDLPSNKNKLIHPNHPQHSAGHPTGTLKQKQSGQNIQNKKQAKSFTACTYFQNSPTIHPHLMILTGEPAKHLT